MSKILKSEAIVLRKIEFGETSYIVHLFAKEYGKISVLAKGARTSKSKLGNLIDILNVIEAIFYEKPTREIQILSSADLIYKPEKIFLNLEKYAIAMMCAELLYRCLVDGYPNIKIFEALKKAIKIINESSQTMFDLPLRFVLFFLKESGYEFIFEHCSVCRKKINSGEVSYYMITNGAICEKCYSNTHYDLKITKELFNTIECLKKRDIEILVTKENFFLLAKFFERYINYHLKEGKIFNSLEIMEK